jgi:hypothetical protein
LYIEKNLREKGVKGLARSELGPEDREMLEGWVMGFKQKYFTVFGEVSDAAELKIDLFDLTRTEVKGELGSDPQEVDRYQDSDDEDYSGAGGEDSDKSETEKAK